MAVKAVPGWAGMLAGAATAVFVTVAGYWWTVVAWLGSFDELAGWVQALGSIAAILWGVWLFHQDNVRRADDIRRRESEFGISFTEIVSLVAAQLRGAERISQHQDLRNGSFSEVTFDRLRFADQMLFALPAEALAGARLAHEAIAVRSRIGQAIRRCAEFNTAIALRESDGREKELEAIRTQISRTASVHGRRRRGVEAAVS